MKKKNRLWNFVVFLVALKVIGSIGIINTVLLVMALSTIKNIVGDVVKKRIFE